MMPFTKAQEMGDYIAQVNAEVCCLYSNQYGLRRVEGHVEPGIGWSFTFLRNDGANDYLSLHPSKVVFIAR